MEIMINGFLISDDKARIQPEVAKRLLNTTYWAGNRTLDVVKKSIETSMCVGIYKEDMQVGFARIVTDDTTIYWLCDVVIDDKFRGRGLGKALIDFISNHQRLKPLRGLLMTRDAHGLYAQYGFAPIPTEAMTKPRPNGTVES